MKLAIFVLLAVSTSTLDAQAEPDYQIRLEKIAPCDSDANALADISALKLTKINSSAINVDGKIILKQDVPSDTNVKINVLKHSLGSWMPVPLNLPSGNVCEVIQKDTHIAPTLLKHSDFPKKCPYAKGSYKITNAVLVAKKMPMMLPKGCFKAEVVFQSSKLKKPACFYGIAKIAGNGDTSGSCVH